MSPLPKRPTPRPLPQIAIPALLLRAMREALEARDFASLEEIAAGALVLWHQKRQRELEALGALSREIETALSGKKPDLKRIAELRAKGRALLGASEELR